MALITLAEYKAFAGISSTDATRDASLNAMIAETDDAIKRYLHQNIESATYTTVMDAPNDVNINLPQLPVSFTDFSIYVNWNANGDPSLFTSDDLLTMYTDYLLDPSPDSATISTTGIVRSMQGWWGLWYQRNGYVLTPKSVPAYGCIKVVYTAGYATVPASIKAAANLLVSKLYMMRKIGMPENSTSLNGYSVSWQSAATANGILQGDPTIRSLLKPFGRQLFVGSYY